jgi:hypothetical protein
VTAGRCTRFHFDIADARYLFGDEVVRYLDGLYSRGLAAAALRAQLYPDTGGELLEGEQRSQVLQAEAQELAHLMDVDALNEVFSPYLRISDLEI